LVAAFFEQKGTASTGRAMRDAWFKAKLKEDGGTLAALP